MQTLPGMFGSVTCLVWLVLETRRSRRSRVEATVTAKGSFALLLAAYIVGISAAVLFALWVPWAAISPAWAASVAGLLVMVGIGLLLANWLSVLALAVAVVAGMSYRIAVEERTLVATLGQPYENYRSGRKRLIPLVW